MTEIFNTFLVNPIINVLVLIYTILSSLGVPFALGFSIIVLTVLIKIITFPLTATQLKSAHEMQKLKPHLDRVKDKYKNDKTRLQQETMRLYKEHGINPAAGCFPLLIQLPIFIALYNVFIQIVNANTGESIANINKILYADSFHLDKPWDPNFFGVSLAATPSQWTEVGVILLSVPIITAGLQFIQSKMMMPKEEKVQPVVEKKNGEDFQKIMQTQMVYFLPLMIGVFAYTFPIGLSLYWNVFTVFGILQQHLISREAGQKAHEEKG